MIAKYNGKVVLIIAVILTIQFKTLAQMSNKIVKNNSVWIENIPDWAFGYSFGKDTLINSFEYKILERIDVGINGGTIYSKTDYLLREEKGVIYLKAPQQDEKILYNFNLTEGDSFNFSFENNNTKYRKLYKIDSIKLNDNSYSKMYFFEDVEFYEMAEPEYIWIEGIGSLASLIYSIDKESSLRCYTENNIRYFGNKAITNCYAVSIGELHSDLRVKFLNPITNKLNIEFENKYDGEFEVYNYLGECLFKNTFKEQINIDEISWQSGLYNIIIKTNSNKIKIIKLIKL